MEENNKKAASRQFYQQKKQKMLKMMLLKNAEEMSYLLTPDEMMPLLVAAGEPQWEDGPMYSYLWGLAQIRSNDRARFQKTMKRIEDYFRFMADGEEKHDWIEVYLNLLYENPDCSILEWIDTAEKYSLMVGMIRLYSMSGNRPGICFGVKEMSELFLKDRQNGGYYTQCWGHILGDREKRLLKIAEIEYILETNGEDAITRKMNELFMNVDRREGSADEWLGCAGIIFKLWRNGHHLGEYEAVMHSITDFLWQKGYLQALDNIQAACRVIAGERGKKDRLVQWLNCLKTERKLQNKWIDMTTLYIKFMQARGYMRVMQYEKARIIFKHTAAYSEYAHQNWFCAGSLFGQAVSAYEMGEHQEAVRLTAKALAMGARFKYTGIFIEYGKTGLQLIEAYRKMTGLDNGRLVSGNRKKYYYGNVLTASCEGYHHILLRKVKKEVREGNWQEENEKLPMTLTMTEVLVLQHLARGCSNSEIGAKMNIRLTTVKTHVYSIYRKLDVSSRVAAVNRARGLNIL